MCVGSFQVLGLPAPGDLVRWESSTKPGLAARSSFPLDGELGVRAWILPSSLASEQEPC